MLVSNSPKRKYTEENREDRIARYIKLYEKNLDDNSFVYQKRKPLKAIYLNPNLRGYYAYKFVICPRCYGLVKATGSYTKCNSCGQIVSITYRRGKVRLQHNTI